mmetsp:Transcript_61831/g.72269  ORF Transcript_61831/g.72269 Transcript_61831/m.72269 type:complete len:87 (-) Transcript_61831:525-785(-)
MVWERDKRFVRGAELNVKAKDVGAIKLTQAYEGILDNNSSANQYEGKKTDRADSGVYISRPKVIKTTTRTRRNEYLGKPKQSRIFG